MSLMLDLFCGTKSMANAFKLGGYSVFTVDFNSQHEPDLHIDVLDLDVSMLPDGIDVVTASPDCSCFSMAAVGHHWNEDRTPRTDKCINALKVLDKTVNLLEELDCIGFVENPRCMTRKQEALKRLEGMGYVRQTVSYCKYGDIRMKPTDIWTNNLDWHPRPMCKPKRKGSVVDCHHVPAPRGSFTGTQGMSAIDGARIPEELCIEIMQSCGVMS